ARALTATPEQRAQVERVARGIPSPALAKTFDPSDRLVQRAQAETGEELPHLACDATQARLDHLARAADLGPKLRPLRRDAGRRVRLRPGQRWRCPHRT